MKILRVIALTMAVMLFVGACGGGDEDEANEGAGAAATEAEAAESSDESHDEHAQFCASVVEAETAVQAAASGGGDPGAIDGLLATVDETTPPELEEQVGVVLSTVQLALQKKDNSVFENEEFSTNEEEVDAWLADNCGFEAVDVSAVDYAFEGVPETLPAGTTTFTFNNDGKEVHEMVLLKYKDESMTIDDLLKLSQKEAQGQVEFLGASFGPPGTVDTESRELSAGKYAMVCFIPVGATSEKALRKAQGPPHAMKGMTAEFTVE